VSFVDFSAPLLKSFASIPRFIGRTIPFASLREEKGSLLRRIELLSRELEEMKFVAEENRRLRDLLDFSSKAGFGVIPAQVIGRDPTNWSNTLIIDKGATDGVRPNRAVVSTKGLVGRTVEVGRRSTKVLLITDPNSKVGVLIARNRHGGVLIGRPDARCRMIYISPDADVSIGDKVITAGLGGIFPKGMLVGEVVKIDKEPGRLYKYAVVKPADDLSKLEEVLCVR
jgi:rod shape-determining protein MreC